MKKYKIAVIPGDGIGPEVTKQGLKVLDAASSVYGLTFEKEILPWGSDYYLDKGKLYDDDAFEVLKKYDAIFVGSIGDPRVPDFVTVQLIINTRFNLDQYINLRPVKGYKGVPSYFNHIKPEEIDFVVIRENSEGEYSNTGGRFKVGTEDEIAIQTGIFTRKGTERAMRYAFEVAKDRKNKGITKNSSVTNCTKSNALRHSMVFWDSVFEEVSRQYPEIETRKALVDAITMWLIKNPKDFDVIVASNLFGDIITDLASTLQGGMGFAAGGNINPEKTTPSMFEPIHGSAPKYTGKNVVNPIATILAVKMMLDHLGETEASNKIEEAVSEVLAKKEIRTMDMGGTTSTEEVGEIIAKKIYGY